MNKPDPLEMIQIHCTVCGQTQAAILIRTAASGARTEWVPLGLVTVSGEREDGSATLRITRALAMARGLA